MNTKKLKELAKKNVTAERILRMVADRCRNTVYTAFSGLRADLKKRDGSAVDRDEFDSTFRDLEELGIGTVNKSPRGVFLGFIWCVPVRHVGAALKTPSLRVVESIAASELVGPAVDAKKPRRTVTLVIVRPNGAAETMRVPEKVLNKLAA